MNYSIGEKKEIILVGMKYYGDNSNNEIRELWDEFKARIGEIENRVNVDTNYGYDTWTEEININGKFTYVAGVEVSDDTCIPNGMELINIPSNKYAIFKIDNYKYSPNFDKVVKHIYKEIIPKEGLQISSDYDFEVFDDQDIYFHVPVK